VKNRFNALCKKRSHCPTKWALIGCTNVALQMEPWKDTQHIFHDMKRMKKINETFKKRCAQFFIFPKLINTQNY
jgi:hypothetical protein